MEFGEALMDSVLDAARAGMTSGGPREGGVLGKIRLFGILHFTP